MVNEPSWRLGNEEDEYELDEGGNTLENGRDSPAPCVGNAEGTVCSPGSDDCRRSGIMRYITS